MPFVLLETTGSCEFSLWLSYRRRLGKSKPPRRGFLANQGTGSRGRGEEKELQLCFFENCLQMEEGDVGFSLSKNQGRLYFEHVVQGTVDT
ncbi:hypothetical protein APED_20475 [Acanthopleuribacter pedis]